MQQGQLFHGALDTLLVLAQHAIRGPRFVFERFVDVFKFDDFALEFFKLSLELVSFPFNVLKLFFKKKVKTML